MPSACPTWAKWVGQAHLACSLPRKALLKSRLCSCSCAAGSHSSPRKKSFPGGPAGKCLIILDSLLSSSIQDGGSVWWVRGTAVVGVIYEYGFKWYFLLTCCLVYRCPLPGVGVWGLGSRLSTWMESLSGPWVSPRPLSQRPSAKWQKGSCISGSIAFFRSAGPRLMCHGARSWHQNSYRGRSLT